MGQEEGTVSYPRSLSSASSSSASSMPAGADPNKCYTEWDFCNAGSEAENAYFWRLGWYAAASERGEVSVSLQEFMGGQAPVAPMSGGAPAAPIIRRNPSIGPTRAAPSPEVSPDLPWGRAYCLLTHPGNPVIGVSRICGWDATLPPGMYCWSRRMVSPWDCTLHVTFLPWMLTGTADG